MRAAMHLLCPVQPWCHADAIAANKGTIDIEQVTPGCCHVRSTSLRCAVGEREGGRELAVARTHPAGAAPVSL